MYEAFYGFKEKPFSMLPDPGFLYLSKKHQAALTLLEYGLLNHVGFCVISGEAGAGKTTILRALLERIEDDVTVGLITNTHQSFGGLLDWVLSSFDLHRPDLTHVEMHQIFMEFLIEEYANGHTVLLIVDEAQNMQPDVLEELRMLSNVNSAKDQLMQVVLAGQPALKNTLRMPDLMQFAQRIAVDYHLESLNLEETCGYIQHRLVVAGAEKDVFTPAACERIHNFSGGTPRLINLLCETVLVYGFADQQEIIGVELVDEMVLERMKDSVVPIVNRDVAKQDNSEVSKKLEKDFPWISPKDGNKKSKSQENVKTQDVAAEEESSPKKEIEKSEATASSEKSGSEKNSSEIKKAKTEEPEKIKEKETKKATADKKTAVVKKDNTKADVTESDTKEKDSKEQVNKEQVNKEKSTKEKNIKENSAKDRGTKKSELPTERSASTLALSDIDSAILQENVENENAQAKGETKKQLIKYGVAATVIAAILIVAALMLGGEEIETITATKDAATEPAQQQTNEQDGKRLRELQVEAETLKKERDAAIAKAEEERKANQQAEKKAAQQKKKDEEKRLADVSKKEKQAEKAAAKARAEAKRAKRETARIAEEKLQLEKRLEEEQRLKKNAEIRRQEFERMEAKRQELHDAEVRAAERVAAEEAAAEAAETKAAAEAATLNKQSTKPKDERADCSGPTARFKSGCR